MAVLYNPDLSNPALSEEPRDRAMKVVPLLPRESILGWLESSGRLRCKDADEAQEMPNLEVPETLDDLLEPEVYSSESEEE